MTERPYDAGYDGGGEARQRHSRFLARVCRATVRTLLPGTAPTAKALERHAERFGPEQVAETAAEYGIAVTIGRAKTPAHRKASGPSLKQRVAGYVAEGHGVEVIAEMENLSPSRARQLIQEVSA